MSWWFGSPSATVAPMLWWLVVPGCGGVPSPAPAPHVLFVVLDTVRADHLSVCGYPLPTTPVLERLRDEGASVQCHGIAPGGWTLPSHASFFTGLDVIDHGVWRKPGEHHNPHGAAWPVVPLAPTHETLATRFARNGYHTRALVGNPALAAGTGLHQGFERVEVAAGWSGRRSYRGDRFAPALRRLLADVDPTIPNFLFINVFDAHDPYPAVPAGVPWAAAQPPVTFAGTGPDGAPRRFTENRMSPDERADYVASITRGYDWGVHQADARLGEVLDAVRAAGLFDRPWRLVVTSDHGEYLGEHTLLRHGVFLYEPNQRIPIVVASSDGAPELPSPVSGRVVYDLVLRGTLPSPLPPVRAAEAPHHTSDLFPTPAAAWWRGEQKWSWIGPDRWEQYNLTTDPEERSPHPLSPTNARELADYVGEVQESLGRSGPAAAGLDEILEGLGYVD